MAAAMTAPTRPRLRVRDELVGDVLTLWFSAALWRRPPLRGMRASDFDDLWLNVWFAKGAAQRALDARIATRFGAALERAAAGQYDDVYGDGDAVATLALVVLLDQFSRQVWRGTPRAWAQDARALRLVKRALLRAPQSGAPHGRGGVGALPRVARAVLYFPFMHAECVADARRGAGLYAALVDEARAEGGADAAVLERFARIHALHLRHVETYGRYPERNRFLGRDDTERERAYLAQAQYLAPVQL